MVRASGLAAFPGFSLRCVARTGSTQDVVRAAARSGAPAGFCCVAAEQTAGQGRQGRRWEAPAGTSLLMSLLLPGFEAGGIPLAAGLAVVDAIAATAAVSCQLKWPNDVFAGGRKLAGILAELEPRSGGVVLGIGVNLTVPAFPPGVPGVSLHELASPPPSLAALLSALLVALRARLDLLASGGVPGLRPDWTAVSTGLAGPIRASVGAREVSGTAVGIDDDGALLVETGDGLVRLVAGDVHFGP